MLLQLYGPIGIQIYGVCISIGIVIFSFLVSKDKRFTQLRLQHFFSTILSIGIFAGIVGGRLLFLVSDSTVITQWTDVIDIWRGGFSILGSIIAIVCTLPLYLRYHHIPILPFLDLMCLYGGILQAISRLGCFYAGCCYGVVTTMPWAVIYTDPASLAPQYEYIHPTQLYSAIMSLIIFLLFFFVLNKKLTKSGTIACAYLMASSLERFIVDFWRADRIMVNDLFSYHQIVAILLFGSACIGYALCYARNPSVTSGRPV